MSTPNFDIENEEAELHEVKKAMESLPTEIRDLKIQEMKVFQESAAEFGPTTYGEAIAEQMRNSNIGVRNLAQLLGMKRGLLQKMLRGEVDVPVDVAGRCFDIFAQLRPEVYKNL